ncbi:hypothetical protein BURK2_04002 [Burkholderiales bacterium]|nr:MAG: DUF1161 domain-containing protein [Burkholderiales bacterium]CAG1010230.1 hypothetical protein BURK2_04002 [Burkholderiales bacterium]
MNVVKSTLLFLVVALTAAPALARKDCDELKAEIDAKLQEKKVAHYTLEVVEADKAGDAKVVGSCDAGSKKITYRREKKEKPAS